MFNVSYNIKNSKNLIVEKNKSFKDFLEAYKYMSRLKNKNTNIVGKPTVEEIDETREY